MLGWKIGGSAPCSGMWSEKPSCSAKSFCGYCQKMSMDTAAISPANTHPQYMKLAVNNHEFKFDLSQTLGKAGLLPYMSFALHGGQCKVRATGVSFYRVMSYLG